MSAPKPKFFHIILNGYFRLLCILAVDLVITVINSKILALAAGHHRMLVTVVGMVVVLLLFAFLFSIIDKLTKFVLKITIEMGNLLAFRKTAIFLLMTGLLIGIFSLYHYVWFGLWPDYRSLQVQDLYKLIQL